MLFGKIKNFSYQKEWKTELDFFDIEEININDLPSKSLVTVRNKTMAISKWVSPKRTRSYPYARVYDTYDQPCACKVVTIIPLIKDEGADGDMDYLQWDTVSLMSLLNVYVIIGYYSSAENNLRRKNKITHQCFNHDFILKQLELLTNYHQSALHWNLDQLSPEKLSLIAALSKESYQNISEKLRVEMHSFERFDNFSNKLTHDRELFMKYSRDKAQTAQNREFLTLQPKESLISIGKKKKITLENYLGGYYFFTVDDVLEKSNTLYLIESKHSKNSLLPSNDDIKDGLLKLMLYNNISTLKESEQEKTFEVVLRLTSSMLRETICLPQPPESLEHYIHRYSFTKNQSATLHTLNKECQINHFEIWVG